jgi:diguanylate cyclase (GGDEF)-like protein
MPDISKRLEKAEKYLQKGKLDNALEEYMEALVEDPANYSVRQTAADLALSLGKNAAGAVLISELFEHHLAIGDRAKASAAFKKLSRVGTASFDQALRFAQFCEKSSKREALDAYEHVLKLCETSGRNQEGLAALKRLVALDPGIDSYRRLAEFAVRISESHEAASAFVQLGVALEKQDKDASDAYSRAYTLDPENPGAALGHGRCLVQHGDGQRAIPLLEPLANYPSAPAAAREAYAGALISVNRFPDAEPFLWEMFERDQKFLPDVCRLIGALVDIDKVDRALTIARRLEEHQRRAGMLREFVAQMKEVGAGHNDCLEFLEYLVELFNSSNREHEYCDTLLRLFELHYAAGDYLRALDELDRAAEVDPYEPGHEKRMEMLRGKVEPTRFASLASRFNSIQKKETPEATAEQTAENETTVLEDLMLQAEIFLQYSMRSKAVERLERIFKLFPHEEDKSEKLRKLYASAGLTPKYTDTQPSPNPADQRGSVTSLPVAEANENAVDNISRVTEITRNLYRQGNVKGVLFAAVNDVGRHWNADRCIAGLCTPGKPPSAALEYCAPGVRQSDVQSIVKLITALQKLCVTQGAVLVNHAQAAPELAALHQVIAGLGIESLLGVPMMDGDQHTGILLLEQCGMQREWRSTDQMVLRTIADQMVLAVNNARLRSLVKTLAVTDEKSGLLKRTSYVDVLLSETRRSLQQNSPTSIVLLDLGKASTLVREFGEAAVEELMQTAGQLIASHLRQNDVAVRYDKTIIALILADTNDKNAFFVIDKARKLLNTLTLPDKQSPLMMTAGIAEAFLNSDFDPVDIVTEVINRAEAALAAAKASGVNSAKSLAANFGFSASAD